MNSKVIYWMNRAIRIEENLALLSAQQIAKRLQSVMEVVFIVQSHFEYANYRNMHFMLHGVVEVATKLSEYNIRLRVIEGEPIDVIKDLMARETISALVTEHHVLNPFVLVHKELENICHQNGIKFFRFNTANVVEVWEASPKLEFGARTFRPKIMSKYRNYLGIDQSIVTQSQSSNKFPVFNKQDVQKLLSNNLGWQKLPISKLIPGEDAASNQLIIFIENGLKQYHIRNQFYSNGQSMMSAYLHFGMISPRKVIREIELTKHVNAALYVEEALVRRELAENYCFYCSNYDSLEGAWPWAVETLQAHEFDNREYIYSLEDFESASTHDDLWNFCQKQVIETGYLHSYLRMYWAKMVLYWTKNAQDAITILIHLNDKYMLDGLDPNGYAGIMWSVAGVHDRPWFNQPIIGLVRSMSKKGTLKKTQLNIK